MLRKEFRKILEDKELRNRKVADLFDEGAIKIGDLIPYTFYNDSTTISGHYTGCEDQTFHTGLISVQWQAIGTEGPKNEKWLKISSSWPIFKLKLTGEKGFFNGVNVLNDLSKLFGSGQYALKARSAKIKDINELLGVVIDWKNEKVLQEGKSINVYQNFLKKGDFSYVNIPYYKLQDYGLIDKSGVKLRAYSYMQKYIKGHEVEKKIVFCDKSYYLADISIGGDVRVPEFGIASVIISNGGSVCNGPEFREGISISYASPGLLFRNDYTEFIEISSIRPIIYLKPETTLDALLEEKLIIF